MNRVNKKVRSESEIFSELEELCSTPGFVHVIAFFCFKDTFLHTTGEGLTAEILSQQYDRTRLSRTELSSLIGLTCKNGLTLELLSKEKIEEFSSKAWFLLEELHKSFFVPSDITEITKSVLDKGFFMREAIFYSGEGVYKHQYRDISQYRYQSDSQWIHDNKGFDLQDIPKIIEAIEQIQTNKIDFMVNEAKSLILDNYLPMFEFTIDELTEYSGLEPTKIQSVVESFCSDSKEGMDSFVAVDDFNYKNAFPILKLSKGRFITFQAFSLWESQYESPFFWFNADKAYKTKASENRGAFTEKFTAKRLATVFTEENVYTNIDIFHGKNKAAEIDVLITHGDTAIIVQAKSKKLTVAARKGNSKKLEEDFKKAVQDAYDQAYLCADLLGKDSVVLKNSDGVEITLKNKLNTIHPFCIVSDYYPALAFQAKQFLKYKITKKIKHPYVMDVFLIDLLAEMLDTPLFFLDYIRKRSDFGESIISHHELVILSTYLKQNLYFEDKPDLVMLAEDISADLELAMLARREGHDVPATPKGILTLHAGTYIGTIINDIKKSEDIGLMNLGYHFLSLSGETIDTLNDAIDQMVMLYKEDKKHHDISVPLLEEKTGLTIHCNDNDGEQAYKSLVMHCEKRKYSVKADTWFGVCLSPTSKRFRFSTFHSSTWKQSDEMDRLIRGLPQITDKNKIKDGKVDFFKMRPAQRKKKIGRNDPCPCGSGKKYKKCCLKR